MLTGSSMNQEISTVMVMIVNSELEAARKKLTAIAPNAKTERMRGVLTALNGIIASLTKKKEGSLQSWEEEKILRAVHQIMKSQMTDDFDKGFSETLAKYAKLQKPAKSQE